MKTQEILSIVALSLLGLCFLCGLAKMAMKKDSDKKNCDKACSMAIFAAAALVGVSQLLTETEKYVADCDPLPNCGLDGSAYCSRPGSGGHHYTKEEGGDCSDNGCASGVYKGQSCNKAFGGGSKCKCFD